MIDILCIGHAAYDLSFSLDEFPREDQKYAVSDGFSECGGGPAANAAYLLSKWRLASAYAGLVGNDIYGEAALKELDEAKVDLSLVLRPEGFDTPLSGIIINGQNGSRTIINRRNDAAPVPMPDQSLWEKISPEVILTDGHYLTLAREAMKRFPEAPVILDAGSVREGTLSLAREADFLLASEAFALQATGLPDLGSPENRKTALEALYEMNGAYVAITRGARGLIYKSPEGEGEMAAFPAKTVDTTGAGDIFYGAFAYCLYWGMEWEESLAFSSLAASYSVQHRGGRPSIPELHSVITGFEKLGGGSPDEEDDE